MGDLDIKTIAIFGDLDKENIKQARKSFLFEIEKLINNGARKFYFSNYGLFYAMAMSVCYELKPKYHIEITQVLCSHKEVKRTQKLVDALFSGVKCTTWTKSLSLLSPLIQNLEKMIDLSDEIVVFLGGEKSLYTETAINYAKRIHKNVIKLF